MKSKFSTRRRESWQVYIGACVTVSQSTVSQSTILQSTISFRFVSQSTISPFHNLLENSVKTLVNENLAERSNLFRPFHNLLVISITILVNENLAKKSPLFRPFHNLPVNTQVTQALWYYHRAWVTCGK